jgi:hypothetical protein
VQAPNSNRVGLSQVAEAALVLVTAIRDKDIAL